MMPKHAFGAKMGTRVKSPTKVNNNYLRLLLHVYLMLKKEYTVSFYTVAKLTNPFFSFPNFPTTMTGSEHHTHATHKHTRQKERVSRQKVNCGSV